MFIDLEKVSIFVKPGVTDMRKQINGLTVLVEEEMAQSSMSGSLFLFCNRDRRLIKCIYWDETGFCLWLKRLEKARYPWPKTEQSAREITLNQLKMLLSGIDFWNAHKKLSYKEVT